MCGASPHVPLCPRTRSSQIRTSTFFHIWFRQTKYFNIVLLISTGKMSTRTPVVFTKMETRKKRERNETLVEEVPPPKEKLNKKPPKKVTKPLKSTATYLQKARKKPGVTKVTNTTEKRNCSSCRADTIGRARIWTTGRTTSAKRSTQLDRTRKCPPPRI